LKWQSQVSTTYNNQNNPASFMVFEDEEEKTRYGSPIKMQENDQWQWSNFTWRNPFILAGTTVGWRIYYSDTNGNINCTDVMNFTIKPSVAYVDNDYNPSTPGWLIDHFDKIQTAIDVVAENGSIYIHNGTYYENIVIDKSINLIGENKDGTIIDGVGTSDTINIAADWINIFGFTVKNSSSGGAGIKFYDAEHCIIGNINASDNEIGIYIYYSSNNSINNVTAINNAYGILLSDSSNYSIVNTIVSNNDYYGIILGSSNYCTITNTTINNNGVGIYLYSSANCTIFNTNANNNEYYGIWLINSANNTIFNTKVSNNHQHGIRLDSSNGNLIYNNYFNNTYNAYDNGNNRWNITKTSGTNIIGGTYLGGNY